jgi:hypothetical protein
MKTIERVMQAYRHCHPVTDEQAEFIRRELSAFIDELLIGKLPARDNQTGPRPQSH